MRAGAAAGEAGIAEGPGVVSGAGECGGVDPVETALVAGARADTADAIGVLVAVAGIPPGRRGVETGSGSRGIALAAGECGGDVGSGLGGEDGCEAPASDECICGARHIFANEPAAPEGQVIETGGVPADGARAIGLTPVGFAIEHGHGTIAAAALAAEADAGGALVSCSALTCESRCQ